MQHQRQQTILIAENNAADAFLLRRAFRKADLPCQLRFVADGQEALTYIQGNAPYTDRDIFPRPALLLLDLDIPLVTGFDVLRWLKANPAFNHLPVVILSSSATETDKALEATLGARGYYVKSVDPVDSVNMFKELGKQWLDPK